MSTKLSPWGVGRLFELLAWMDQHSWGGKRACKAHACKAHVTIQTEQGEDLDIVHTEARICRI